eukprot:scaffold10201_cov119-Cylindrotheca_fusiformis.AAC.15
MANITMFDVKEKRIHNEEIREMMGNCYTIHQTMEIRGQRNYQRCQRLETPEKSSYHGSHSQDQQKDRAKQSAKRMRIL